MPAQLGGVGSGFGDRRGITRGRLGQLAPCLEKTLDEGIPRADGIHRAHLVGRLTEPFAAIQREGSVPALRGDGDLRARGGGILEQPPDAVLVDVVAGEERVSDVRADPRRLVLLPVV